MFRLEHYAIDSEVKRLREENARLKYQLAHPVVAVQELKVPMEMVFRIGVDKAVTKAIKFNAYRKFYMALRKIVLEKEPRNRYLYMSELREVMNDFSQKIWCDEDEVDNDSLYERGIITEEDRNRMSVK